MAINQPSAGAAIGRLPVRLEIDLWANGRTRDASACSRARRCAHESSAREPTTAIRIALSDISSIEARVVEAQHAEVALTVNGRVHRLDVDLHASLARAQGRGQNDVKIELAKRTLCRTLALAAQAE
jgi:hypothetical protein